VPRAGHLGIDVGDASLQQRLGRSGATLDDPERPDTTVNAAAMVF